MKFKINIKTSKKRRQKEKRNSCNEMILFSQIQDVNPHKKTVGDQRDDETDVFSASCSL
jgi:hypothetical protein